MTHIPKGCDQQGRYPEAAHCATELGQDEQPSVKGKDFVLAVLLAAFMLGLTALLAWLLPGGKA